MIVLTRCDVVSFVDNTLLLYSGIETLVDNVKDIKYKKVDCSNGFKYRYKAIIKCDNIEIIQYMKERIRW